MSTPFSSHIIGIVIVFILFVFPSLTDTTTAGQGVLWVGTGTATCSGDASAASATTGTNTPRGIAVSALSDNIYWTDLHSIRRAQGGQGGTVSTVVSTCGGASGSNNGAGAASKLNTPITLVFDPDSFLILYIWDSGNDEIRSYDFTSVAVYAGDASTTFVNNVAKTSSGIGGCSYGHIVNKRMYTSYTSGLVRISMSTGTITQLLAFASATGVKGLKGWVYYATTGAHQIRKVNILGLSGDTAFAGTGTAGNTATTIDSVSDLAVDCYRRQVYVLQSTFIVRSYSFSSRTFTTIAGVYSTSTYNGPGPRAATTFQFPTPSGGVVHNTELYLTLPTSSRIITVGLSTAASSYPSCKVTLTATTHTRSTTSEVTFTSTATFENFKTNTLSKTTDRTLTARSSTRTQTMSLTDTRSWTDTQSVTFDRVRTFTSTFTDSDTKEKRTLSATQTLTDTFSKTFSFSDSNTIEHPKTPSWTYTESITDSYTETLTKNTKTPTLELKSISFSKSLDGSDSPTRSYTDSETFEGSFTVTGSETNFLTRSLNTETLDLTLTVSNSRDPSNAATMSHLISITKTLTVSASKNEDTMDFSFSKTFTDSITDTESIQRTKHTGTESYVITEDITLTRTQSNSASYTDTVEKTIDFATYTRSQTLSDSPTPSHTDTNTPEVMSNSQSISQSNSHTETETAFITDTKTRSTSISHVLTVSPTVVWIEVTVVPNIIDGTDLLDMINLKRPVIIAKLTGDTWNDRARQIVTDGFKLVEGDDSEGWPVSRQGFAQTSPVVISNSNTTLTITLGYDDAFVFTTKRQVLKLTNTSRFTRYKVEPLPTNNKPVDVIISIPLLINARDAAATKAAASTAAAMAMANPLSAAALQTMAIVASMPCMSTASRRMGDQVGWLNSPLYNLLGKDGKLTKAQNIVVYNTILVLIITVLHFFVVIVVRSFFSESGWAYAMHICMFPKVSITLSTVFLQSTTTSALRAFQESDSTGGGYYTISVITILSVPASLGIITFIVVKWLSKATWHEWTHVTSHPRNKYILPTGIWLPPEETLKYGSVFEDFRPENKYFNIILVMYMVILSVVASLPGDGLGVHDPICEAQLGGACCASGFLAIAYLWRLPTRSTLISISRGIGALSQLVVPLVTLIADRSAEWVPRVTSYAMVVQCLMMIVENSVVVASLIMDSKLLRRKEKNDIKDAERGPNFSPRPTTTTKPKETEDNAEVSAFSPKFEFEKPLLRPFTGDEPIDLSLFPEIIDKNKKDDGEGGVDLDRIMGLEAAGAPKPYPQEDDLLVRKKINPKKDKCFECGKSVRNCICEEMERREEMARTFGAVEATPLHRSHTLPNLRSPPLLGRRIIDLNNI